MMLPNKESSLVELKKVTKYLLDVNHPIGGPKSAFYFGYGFTLANPDLLIRALIHHANNRDVCETIESDYGTKFILKCEIPTPNQMNPCVLSVWILNKGSETPRLVTAYPNE